MGFIKGFGNFMFGKSPDIFDDNGKVCHKFPEDKWRKWNERLSANPDYDWHLHQGNETVLEIPIKADETPNKANNVAGKKPNAGAN